MKSIVPREFASLSAAEKKKINDYCTEVVSEKIYEFRVKDVKECQTTMLKFACIILHNNFKWSKGRVLQFIGSWMNYHRKSNRFDSKEEHDAWVEDQLSFLEGEFPEDFVDKIVTPNDGKEWH